VSTVEHDFVHLLCVNDSESQTAEMRNIPDADLFSLAFITALGLAKDSLARRQVWRMVSRNTARNSFAKLGYCLRTRLNRLNKKCVWGGGEEEQDFACDE
jgi:hypothetical protein